MSDDCGDLSAQARRGALSDIELRRLEAGLEASAEARAWHAAGSEFDAEGAILPGDHAAAQRVSRRVFATLPRSRAGARRRLVGLLIAAPMCLALAAAAAALVARRAPPPAPPAPAIAAPAPRALVGAPRTAAPALPIPGPAPAPGALVGRLPEVSPSAAALLVHRDGSPLTRASAGASPPLESAAQLFSSAAKARREGDETQAIAILHTLQRRYPSSVEAEASDITLGMLQLKRGASTAALTHFQRYLARSPNAALAPDALWGEAQAFAALGQESSARGSLATLVARYPSSTYAAAARARLSGGSGTP